jgi:hypothetical protein
LVAFFDFRNILLTLITYLCKKKLKMKKLSLTLLSFVSGLFFVNAQTLESFSYTGALNTNGWSSHSGTAGQLQSLATASDCQNSLYYAGLEASTGNRLAFTAGNSEDINKAITGITGTGYFSFLLNVPTTTGLSTTGEYFTGFGSTTGASVTRIFSLSGTALQDVAGGWNNQ